MEASQRDQALGAPEGQRPHLTLVSAAPQNEVGLTGLQRRNKLEALMGEPPLWSRIFADAVFGVVFRDYDRWVVPLIQRYWPESLGNADGKKLRFLACNLYAAAPYTALFCSPKRPWLLNLAVGLGRLFRMKPATLGYFAQLALAVFGRVALTAERRRIVLIGSFIATIDHAFDHLMEDDTPEERGDKIRRLLAGEWRPESGPLALTASFLDAMQEGLSERDRPAYDAAVAKCMEWCDSEVKGMTGVPDPLGLCHRLAGVEGTIDGLIFPVYNYAGENAREWQYGVSLFVQMMDDWIDYEKDLADIRETPVITGKWTFADVEAKWHETVDGIQDLARTSGLDNEAYLEFVRGNYVFMMREVMQAMSRGTAA
jgi:hypothetical protein